MDLYITVVDRDKNVLVEYVDETIGDTWGGPLARTIYSDPKRLKGFMVMGYSAESHEASKRNAVEMIDGLLSMARQYIAKTKDATA